MRATSETKLSIAIITRNRPESLYEAVKSVSRQSVRPYEIVISDDSNQKDLINRNKEIALKFGCIYYEGPKRGLYSNRNFIAKKCTGTHFRTMDDDHFFPKDHLKECLKAIEKEPETIWTIGEYYPDTLNKFLPPPVPGQLHPRGFSVVPKDMENYYGISCGGTIYPSKVVAEMILNCELYKFGNIFLEYGARLSKKGYKIRFLTTTYFIHNAVETTAHNFSCKKLSEARLFSMFCLSFEYQRTIYNKLQTVSQIAYELCLTRYTFKEVKQAYRNYKLFPKN